MASPKYYSVIESRMRWAWHVARMGKVHRWFWWGDLGERDPTGRREHIKMDPPEVGWVGMDWIDLSR